MTVFTLDLEKKLESDDTIDGLPMWSVATLLDSATRVQSFTDPGQKNVSKHIARD